MSTSFVLIAVVVSAIAIAVVLAPLRGKQRQAAPGRTHREPVSDYQDTLMALRDLDFDHELGVVADDDYLRLREELVARAAQTMPKKKSRRAASRKKSVARGRKGATGSERVAASVDGGHGECPQCGRAFQPEYMFCGKCGTRLSAA